MRLSLTKHAEYALRILIWLAQQPCGRYKAAEISAASQVPPIFATRILAQLQRQGLLEARAGQHGGYVLERTAAKLSLLEVVESVEGPLVTTTCVLRDMACGGSGGGGSGGANFCVLHSAWSAAQAALRDVLAATSLESAVGASGAAGAGNGAAVPEDTQTLRLGH
jgi:Rrf2 family transcriptional regulator, iron-sulfur cluster assembly transcription factor